MINKLKDIVNNSLGYVLGDYVSKRDIMYLIKETFSLSDVDLILKENELFDDEVLNNRLIQLVEGLPVEYIVGYAYFLKMKFKVTSDTLIPRGETEDLIYHTINLMKEVGITSPRILDIGSGTGCIAISLNKMVPDSNVDSVDISSYALEVSEYNNELNGTNVKFYQSDCFENVNDKFDVIISNPPYIDRDSYVQKSVLLYEPHTALFADNKGLAIYENIIKNAKNYIKNKAILTFEISPDLKEGLSKLVEENFPSSRYYFEEDINGFIRYLFIVV